MAELATIARPYAEALFKAIAANDAGAVSEQVNALAAVAANEQVRQFAMEHNQRRSVALDEIRSLSARLGSLPKARYDAVRQTADDCGDQIA